MGVKDENLVLSTELVSREIGHRKEISKADVLSGSPPSERLINGYRLKRQFLHLISVSYKTSPFGNFHLKGRCTTKVKFKWLVIIDHK